MSDLLESLACKTRFWCEQIYYSNTFLSLFHACPMTSRWHRALQSAWWCDARETLPANPRMRAGCAGTHARTRARVERPIRLSVARNLPGNPKMQRRAYAYGYTSTVHVYRTRLLYASTISVYHTLLPYASTIRVYHTRLPYASNHTRLTIRV